MEENMQWISDEYIRGLTEGEGTFTFYTVPQSIILSNGDKCRQKMPAFAIKMHERDWNLLDLVRLSLNLKGRIYHNRPYRYDRYGSRNTSAQVTLLVRDVFELRDIIIPLFYSKLHGHKGKQFLQWLENMGGEEMTRHSQYLHRIYQSGYFDKLINK
jgi:hypothetical protein